MSNDTRESSSLTQEDVSRLRQTATDAVNDMDFTGAAQGPEVKSSLKKLVQHLQGESGEQIKGVLNSSRCFISSRPIFCVSLALALGLLIGISHQRRSRE